MEEVEKTKVEESEVNALLSNAEVIKVGKKSTVVCVTLPNGFEIVESAACVDPANYDEELGKKYALEKAKSKVWELLGFQLQEKLQKNQ